MGDKHEKVPTSGEIRIKEDARSSDAHRDHVSTSDNMYVQFRLMKNQWSITNSDWQGITNELIPNSNNLITSGGVKAEFNKIKTPDCFSFARVGTTPFIKIENSDNQSKGKYKISLFNNNWAVTSSKASNVTISLYSKELGIKTGGGWYFIFYDFTNSEFYYVHYLAYNQSSIRHNTDLFVFAADYRGTADASFEDTDIIQFHYVNATIVGYLDTNQYTFNSPIDKWIKVDNLENVISHCKVLDSVPTENSENAIKSSAVYNAVAYQKTINSLLAPFEKHPFIKIENSDDLTRGKYKISIFAGGWTATSSGSSNTVISAYSKEIAGGVSQGWWMIFYDQVYLEFYKISWQGLGQNTIRHSTDIFVMAVNSDPNIEVGEITTFSYVNSPLVDYLGTLYYTFNSHINNWVKKEEIGENNAIRFTNTLLAPFTKTSFIKIEDSDDQSKGRYKISIFNNSWFITLNGSRNTTSSFYSKDFNYANNWVQIFYDIKQNEFYSIPYSNFKNSDIRNATDLFVLSCNYDTTHDIRDFTYVNAPVVNYLGEDYYTFNSNFTNWIKASNIKQEADRQSNMYIFQIGDSITWQKDNKLNDDPITNPTTYKGHGFMRYVCEQMNIPPSHHFPRGFNGQTVCGYANYLDNNPNAFPKNTTNMSNVIWVVELGTNDWGNLFNEPLGTKADYLNKTGNSTMYGALRTLVDYMVEDIDDSNIIRTRPQVVMLTPMDRGAYSNSTQESWRPCSFQYDTNGDLKFTPNNTGATINDYADAIRWVCEREGFVCVDFIENPICPRKYMNLALSFETCVMRPNDDKKPEVYQDIYVDNLHPSDKGDVMMGRLIYQKMMQFFYDSNI